MKILLFSFGLIFFIQNCFGDFPSDVEKCRAGDVSCIARITTELIRKYSNGRPDVNLPNLEPLRVDTITISQIGNSSPVNLNLSFNNLDVFGLSQVNIDKAVGFTEDPNTSKFEFYGTIPQLRLKGNYKASGRILILPIEGEGPCDITIENVKASIKFKPIIMNKNGKIYLGVEKLKLLLEPEKLKIRLDNLFNGDRALGDSLNTFLNENDKDVWNELSSIINAGVAEVLRAIVQNILKLAPYDDIYKKD